MSKKEETPIIEMDIPEETVKKIAEFAGAQENQISAALTYKEPELLKLVGGFQDSPKFQKSCENWAKNYFVPLTYPKNSEYSESQIKSLIAIYSNYSPGIINKALDNLEPELVKLVNSFSTSPKFQEECKKWGEYRKVLFMGNKGKKKGSKGVSYKGLTIELESSVETLTEKVNLLNRQKKLLINILKNADMEIPALDNVTVESGQQTDIEEFTEDSE